MIGSGESDQESDDVEIEEVEESGSNLDEDFDKAEEIVVWDDKRKTNKKANRKKIASKIARVGPTSCNVYAETEKWYLNSLIHRKLRLREIDRIPE